MPASPPISTSPPVPIPRSRQFLPQEGQFPLATREPAPLLPRRGRAMPSGSRAASTCGSHSPSGLSSTSTHCAAVSQYFTSSGMVTASSSSGR